MEEDPDRERIEEARADEIAVVNAHLRSRRTADALQAWMFAGDKVRVTCAGRAFTGRLVAVVGDHAVIGVGDDHHVVNLDGPVTFSRWPSDHGGTRGDRSHTSLRAQLSTLELVGDPVEVVHAAGTERGRIRAVAVDHLLLDGDDTERLIPLAMVGVVSYRFNRL